MKNFIILSIIFTGASIITKAQSAKSLPPIATENDIKVSTPDLSRVPVVKNNLPIAGNGTPNSNTALNTSDKQASTSKASLPIRTTDAISNGTASKQNPQSNTVNSPRIASDLPVQKFQNAAVGNK